jgi:two-component system response regulator BaeR
MRTLLVNKRQLEAELIGNYLQKNGYEIAKIVNTGYDALEYLKENIVDLILIDMVIGGFDGIQAMKFLRKKFGFDVKALIIHDIDEGWIKKKSFEAGSDGYISKEMEPAEMLKIIESL